MKNKIIIALFFGSLLLGGCGNPARSSVTSDSSSSAPSSSHETSSAQSSSQEDTPMSASRQEYEGYLKNLATFPINFVYDEVYFHGFGPAFRELSRIKTTERKKETTTIVFAFKSEIEVTLIASYYEGYDAFEWTVYFENISPSANTKVLRYLNDASYRLPGAHPLLKGIYGDHEKQYAAYEKDLAKEDVSFVNDLGRSCHRYFPYFNLENDQGGALLSIGWAGTWKANFHYDPSSQSTLFEGAGTYDFSSYLKPGEKVRTALISVVRYDVRDEDVATNKWRKWYVDYNLPKDADDPNVVVQPKECVILSNDTGVYNFEGSITETSLTWKSSLEKIYSEGLKPDIRWVDAGWYSTTSGGSVTTDWWGTVGTWEMDTKKWPEATFQESVSYAREHGTETLVWFEPERITNPRRMESRYGYDSRWIISDQGDNGCYVNNLGNKDCYNWVLNRVLTSIAVNHIDIYREDFNIDPHMLFIVNDGYEGMNRHGITENLYYQAHYKMWDEIIAYTSSHGGAGYIDSCASGGGRNDLESMRRSVPFNRSDSEWVYGSPNSNVRLSMTSGLNKWLPWSGVSLREVTSEPLDMYFLRTSYMASVNVGCKFTHNASLDFDLLRTWQSERDSMTSLLYKDYYLLTPFHSVNDDKDWTAYEYFDNEKGVGLLQAFRPANCSEKEIVLTLKGVKDDALYALKDPDGLNGLAKIKGSALKKGFRLHLENARSSAFIQLEEIK